MRFLWNRDLEVGVGSSSECEILGRVCKLAQTSWKADSTPTADVYGAFWLREAHGLPGTWNPNSGRTWGKPRLACGPQPPSSEARGLAAAFPGPPQPWPGLRASMGLT